MSAYNDLKQNIDANIKENGQQYITGPVMNQVLNNMVEKTIMAEDPEEYEAPGEGELGSGYYTKSEIDALLTQLQEKLVSGYNIKTINLASLLGSGNIAIPQGPTGAKGDQGNSGYDGTGVEVVNNLTQGGATAALSAEMGKRLAEGYQYLGIATPDTDPGVPTHKVFYIATTPGTYHVNFGSLTVADGEVAVLKWNSTWSKETTGIATKNEVSQLGQNLLADISLYDTLIYPENRFELGSMGSTVNTKGFWLVEDIQNKIRGKKIFGIVLNIKTVGTLSILKATGVYSTPVEDFNPILVEVLTINKTGVQVLYFSQPLTLENNEWFGVVTSADTARFYFGEEAEVPNQGFYSTENGRWNEYLYYGLNIGVITEKETVVGIDVLEQNSKTLSTKLNDVNIPFGIIKEPFPLGIEDFYVSSLTNYGYWLVDEIQNKFRGNRITGIYLDVAVAGTISILKSNNVNTITSNIQDLDLQVIETIVVPQTGYQFIPLTNPLILEDNEYLGIIGPNDTLVFKSVSSSVSDKQPFHWFNPSDSTFQIYAGTLFIQVICSTDGHHSNDSNDKLVGKKLSILGDSISTFQGYLASDAPGYDGASYAYWYPRGNVQSVENTWWKKLINETGMVLLKNCAWSDSEVEGNSQATATALAGCSDRRIADLADGPTTPDIVICYIGVNDWGHDKALGTFNENSAIPNEGVITNFADAYMVMVDKIQRTYPLARVFCCTLLNCGYTGYDVGGPGIYPAINENNVALNSFNNVIINVANCLGAEIIDIRKCGFTFHNFTQYTIGDKLHPNIAGMGLLKDFIKNQLELLY